MPQIFKVGQYVIYFWSNENEPLEPIHVHVSDGVPSGNSTKIWITQSGKCLLCNNNSKIPQDSFASSRSLSPEAMKLQRNGIPTSVKSATSAKAEV